MRNLLKAKSFKILIAVVLILFGFMMYSASLSGEQNILTAITSFITTPVQKLSALISGGIGSIGDDLTDVETIKAENELLLTKVRELTAQLVDYEELKQENERLRGILQLKQENAEFEFVPATVISRDATDQYGTFIIDKGTAHGVAYLDPVITADGLVGYISEAGPISSKVTTILSPATDIGAIDRRTLDGGVLGGDLALAKNGTCKLSYLARDCEVAAGDIIVTSGLGCIYPKNLVIGEVTEILAESQDISLYAIIQPAADITGCIDVFVISSFNGQGAVVNGELAGTGEQPPAQ
ncbi:MAG: rod shape-determining protein MreC [Clostridia bacterium]|nr:rod shape-determining protein MreC [Clostridia bacterium]